VYKEGDPVCRQGAPEWWNRRKPSLLLLLFFPKIILHDSCTHTHTLTLTFLCRCFNLWHQISMTTIISVSCIVALC
jgi:hypothetical protein